MRYLSVCSGIEAATVAWHPLGWTPVAFSEIEPFPAAVLAHHYPNVPNYGDMTKHKEWPLEPGAIDLLVGGTPCQSFSVAGLRKGISDPRGGLMLTYLEIAQRLRPRWIVWENVPGVLSSGGGRDFGSFLGALGELGYGWAYRVLDAQWVRTQRHPRAVPQRRRRVFVVGCLGDPARAAQVLFERESVQRDSAKGGKAREEIAGTLAARSGECRNNHEHLIGQWWNGGQVAETLNQSKCGGAGVSMMPDKGNFGAVLQPVTVRSGSVGGFVQDDVGGTMRAKGGDYHGGSESLVMWPADVAATLDRSNKHSGGPGGSNQEIFSQHGANLIPVQQPVPYDLFQITAPVNRQNRKPGDPCHTLARDNAAHAAVAFDWQKGNDVNNPRPSTMNVAVEHSQTIGTTRTPAVAHAFYSTGGTHGVNQHPEVSPAVKIGSAGTSGNPPAVAFTRCDNGHDASVEVTPTMRCGSNYSAHPAVACPTLTAHNDPSRSPQSSEVTQQVAAVHAASMTVRRLTPRECERLQAFPDDYTLIPWRKKPATECPDGPRYKALGNSMAVNCMAWIGERIAAVEARND